MRSIPFTPPLPNVVKNVCLISEWKNITLSHLLKLLILNYHNYDSGSLNTLVN